MFEIQLPRGQFQRLPIKREEHCFDVGSISVHFFTQEANIALLTAVLIPVIILKCYYNTTVLFERVIYMALPTVQLSWLRLQRLHFELKTKLLGVHLFLYDQ